MFSCQANLKQEIKHFLANLEVLGSWDPAQSYVEDYTECRERSVDQLGELISKLEALTARMKGELVHNKITQSILLLDLPLLIASLKQLRKVLA